MATQRPLKEGSVRTYQEKVALGFPDILASEMDADLDTIYAAWNGNVGTANLIDGSVTTPKLADSAVTSVKIADGGIATVDLADGAVTTPKLAAALQGPVGGSFPGDVTAAGFLRGKSEVGMLRNGAGATYPNAATTLVALPTVFIDTGSVTDAANSYLRVPATYTAGAWVLVWFACELDGNGGSGVTFQLDEWGGSAWATRTLMTSTTSKYYNLVLMYPAVASDIFRVTVNNQSAATRTIVSSGNSPWFGLAVLGSR
jgi:hypothetical protein